MIWGAGEHLCVLLLVYVLRHTPQTHTHTATGPLTRTVALSATLRRPHPLSPLFQPRPSPLLSALKHHSLTLTRALRASHACTAAPHTHHQSRAIVPPSPRSCHLVTISAPPRRYHQKDEGSPPLHLSSHPPPYDVHELRPAGVELDPAHDG